MANKNTAQDIATILEGELSPAIKPEERIGRFALKAWNMKPKDIFVPILQGAKPNNVKALQRKGIVLIDNAKTFKGDRYILVDNVEDAMIRMAKHNRSQFNGDLIGITGSAGKSTTKTMLNHILKGDFSVFQSMSNQNLTTFTKASLATMKTDIDYAIFELAMYDKDTVRESSELAQPTIAIVTSIGMNHIDNVGGTIENIINAKTELFDHLTGRALVVLPRLDDNFEALLERAKAADPVKEIITVGKSTDDYVQLIDYQETVTNTKITAKVEGQTITYEIGEPGFHFALNSLLALATIVKLGLDPNLIKKLNDYVTPNSSIVRYRVKFNDDREIELYDDAIISSPHQALALFDILKKRTKAKRKVLIFGDMTALGELSTQAHEELAKPIDETGFDLVITAGQHSEKLAQKLETPHITFPDTTYAAQAVLSLIQDGDLVAIKASGPTKMKYVLKEIYANSKRELAKSWTISSE